MEGKDVEIAGVNANINGGRRVVGKHDGEVGRIRSGMRAQTGPSPRHVQKPMGSPCGEDDV